MGTKKFNVKGEAFQEKVKLFQETMKKINKQAIIEAFKLGLEVGYFQYKDKNGQWKRMHPNNDLFYQFNDEKDFVYTLIRMPIIKMKTSVNQRNPIASAILDKKKMMGRKF